MYDVNQESHNSLYLQRNCLLFELLPFVKPPKTCITLMYRVAADSKFLFLLL